MEKTIKAFVELATEIIDTCINSGYNKDSKGSIHPEISVFITTDKKSGNVTFFKYPNETRISNYMGTVEMPVAMFNEDKLTVAFDMACEMWENAKPVIIEEGNQYRIDRIEAIKAELALFELEQDPSFTKFSNDIITELRKEEGNV